MKVFSHMVRLFFLCFLSVCNLSCPLNAMMPGDFSEDAWNEIDNNKDYKILWDAQKNIKGDDHLERASSWRIKRINDFFELTVILAEIRHWGKNGNLEDFIAKEKRIEWLLKAWMIGFIRIVIDENARLEGEIYPSLLSLWKSYYNKYLKKDVADEIWVSAYGAAKDELNERLNKDRYNFEGDEGVSVDQSTLPNFEIVCMIKEKPVLFGLRGSTFEFVKIQSEAVKFFPLKLKELHEKRVLALDDALTWLTAFRKN